MATYQNARYQNDLLASPAGIRVEINGVECFVPLDPANGDYAWLLGLQSAGQISIAAAPDAPSSPAEATNFQIRAALGRMPPQAGMGAGASLFDQIDAAIHAAGGEDLQAWEYANTVARESPMVVRLAAAFGFTATQLDDLFTAAAAISQ